MVSLTGMAKTEGQPATAIEAGSGHQPELARLHPGDFDVLAQAVDQFIGREGNTPEQDDAYLVWRADLVDQDTSEADRLTAAGEVAALVLSQPKEYLDHHADEMRVSRLLLPDEKHQVISLDEARARHH